MAIDHEQLDVYRLAIESCRLDRYCARSHCFDALAHDRGVPHVWSSPGRV